MVILNNFMTESIGQMGAKKNQCQLPKALFDVYELALGMSNNMPSPYLIPQFRRRLHGVNTTPFPLL